MSTQRILVSVLALFLLALVGETWAQDDADRAQELLEALGGSTPTDPAPSQDESTPEASENEDAPLTFAEGGSLPGDLSELLEAYADESGELTDEAVADATEEVQASASADTEEGQALREALDRDGNGAVDQNEAQAGVDQAREFRQNMRQQAGQLFFKHDADADGQLNPQEFTALVQELQLPGSNSEQGVRAMFGRMDADGNSMISAGEAQRAANMIASGVAPGQRRGQGRLGRGQGGDRPGTGGQQIDQLDPIVVAATQQILREFDRNGDSMIGPREAANNVLIAANFAAADTNGDNRLSAEEIYTYIKAQGQ